MKEPLTRRQFLEIAATATAAGIVELLMPGCTKTQLPDQTPPTTPEPTSPTPTPTPEPLAWQSEQLNPNNQFMNGEEANQVAKHLGITTDSFFIFPTTPTSEAYWKQPEILSALSDISIIENYDNYNLPPVFPPSVLKWQPEIKDAVLRVFNEKHIFVPPEVVAMVMTAESCGLPKVNSPEAHINDIGIGLMQVLGSNMRTYIEERGVIGDNMTANQETIYNPRINVLIGTHMLADGIKYVSEKKYSSDPTLINYGPFLADVIQYYNGGPGSLEIPLDQLMVTPGFQGTIIYRDDSQRFLMAIAIANQLRLAGLTDSQIVDQMTSIQGDAKCYALYTLLNKYGNSQYDNILSMITQPDKYPEVQQTIQEYLNAPKWSMPTNLALRIFCKRGGDWLFLKSQENKTDSRFYHMSPQELRKELINN